MKTVPTLHLLFNHTLNAKQEADAFESLDIEKITYFSDELLNIWKNIPSHKIYIKDTLYPIYNYMVEVCNEGDYILIQGDFGGTFQVVQKALSLKMIPIYATTKRHATEKTVKGKVVKTSVFEHCIFRKYGA